MISKKMLGIFVLGMAISSAAYTQNLLNVQEWLPGSGGTTSFIMNGSVGENSREWGISPYGQRAVLWKATPAVNNDADGGWNTTPVSINNQQMYRFSVWIKKTVSNSGTTYLGCDNVNRLDGTFQGNPYFWWGDLPQLDKWYLLVAYIHGSGDTSTVHYGGIYDGVTGTKVLNCTDYKFATTATNTYHRSYFFYATNSNDRQYFYGPRLEMVNGNEPTIFQLLGLSGGVAGGSANFMGKVGIMTTTPGAYELAVNGHVRAHSVRIETSGWPDYVFDSSYQLMSLPETERFVKTYKHLPGIPAAHKVEKDGIELGNSQKLLLQKIEELTLHVIELEKRLAAREGNIKNEE